VKGREPQGIIEPANYEAVRARAHREARVGAGPTASRLGTSVQAAGRLPDVKGVAPDLIVTSGPRVALGGDPSATRAIYTYENDTGPDGANHDRAGVFAMAACGPADGRGERLNLVDVGPSIMELYGIETPEGAVRCGTESRVD